MARKPERDLVKTGAPAGVPDYLREHEDESLEAMREYRVLPRLKVIQNTSHSDLLKLYDPGDVILSPGGALLSKVNKKEQCSEVPFHMVFLFFFPEFCKWSDLNDTESPTIFERSFDPSSDVAKRAKDRDSRFEKYGGKDGDAFVARYVEHLNFAGYIYGEHAFKGEQCVQSFNRGEHGTGTRFINSATMRKAPLWSQVWKFSVGYRETGPQNKWWGLDYFTPEAGEDGVGPFIPEEEVEFFKEAAAELKRLHEAKLLIVDHEGSEDGEDDESSGKPSEF